MKVHQEDNRKKRSIEGPLKLKFYSKIDSQLGQCLEVSLAMYKPIKKTFRNLKQFERVIPK